MYPYGLYCTITLHVYTQVTNRCTVYGIYLIPMQQASAPTLDLLVSSLRTSVDELAENRPNLISIAEWCAVTYVTPGENRKDTLDRLREYLKDALGTIVQQVSSSALALSQSVEQQANELENLALVMRLIENRLSSQKEQLSSTAMVNQFMRKLPAPRADPIEHVGRTEPIPVFRAVVRCS